MSKHALGDAYPPIVWKHHFDFETWKAEIVGSSRPRISEAMWHALYAEQWEPSELREDLIAAGWFNTKRVAYKKVVLTKDDCERRIAQHVYNAAGKLKLRRIEPAAQEYINSLLEWAEKTLHMTVKDA